MKCPLLFLILLIFPIFSHAAPKTYGNVVIDEITSIYDGDTFRANINGWPAVVGQRVPIRVMGIDTPELRAKCDSEKKLARAAKQFTVAKLRAAQRIELRDIQRGKYFRLLAYVFVDGVSLGKMLIDQRLAVAYDGGTKKDWCG